MKKSNKQEVIMGTKELIKNSKDIGLQINESKTKYMKLRILSLKGTTVANKCYYGLTSIFKSKQVSITSKTIIYKFFYNMLVKHGQRPKEMKTK
ncbi:Craniofacial development protein 2 [Aphis craccivora]|uniref:Craniofacial development protein 2 n=1 Tax=Aphis craccivora TaxID=307492 RepID=A0A6G0ZER4_APHCR|nr:Craniofacial development protein 2 [Aphis craccivora]